MRPNVDSSLETLDRIAAQLANKNVIEAVASLRREFAHATGARADATDRHVLVIGGAGYIGNVLVRRLLGRGFRVRCLDALLYETGVTVAPLLERPDFSFVHGDMRNRSVVRGSLDSITDVVLLASMVGDPISKKYPDMTRDINTTGSIQVFETLASYPIDRFVFTSTCSNYGIIPDGALATEDTRLNPRSVYAESKVAFEQFILAHGNAVAFSPTILRLATAFGLSPRMRFDLTVSEFIRSLTLQHELVVYDEATWRPYCHVDDISHAIISVLEADRSVVAGQVFNVGSDGQNWTKQGIVSELLKVVPGKVTYEQGGLDPRDYRVSFDRIRHALSFTPRHTVVDSIHTLSSAIKSGLFSDVDRRGNFYGNYSVESATV